ncbi:hypothetical protein EJB05_31910, partial [Eragrostis curvula]
MARRTQPCNLLLVAIALVAAVAVVADDEKCGSPCGNPCGVPCVYASPPPPSPEYYPPPPPVYSPPPPEYYPPPPPEYYPPPETPTTNCPPPPSGGGYEPTPGYTPTPGGYNPTPSGGGGGWYSPPYTPQYNTPPGTLYPQDPGFRPNDAAGRRATWGAALAAAAAVAGVLAL